MAINLDLLKKKLTQLETANQKGEKVDVLWKPEAGTSIIRIVPYQFDKENPFIELKFHYEFGKQMLSPSTFGRPDPIVDFASKLKSTGKKEDWSLGRKIEPKMRIYVPIIVRGREAEGVKFWGFGNTVYKELLGYLADPDYGDITDPTSGRDLTIEYKSAEEAGTTYPTTTIRVKPNASNLTEDEAKVTQFLESQTEITDLYSELSYDELKSVLEGWLNPTDEGNNSGQPQSTSQQTLSPSTPSSTVTETAQPVAQTTTTDSTKKTDDVAAAFDDLFNN